MVRRFVALTPLRKFKAHAHAACLQRMWRRHFSRHKVRYMFAQRILDVRATRLQIDSLTAQVTALESQHAQLLSDLEDQQLQPAHLRALASMRATLPLENWRRSSSMSVVISPTS